LCPNVSRKEGFALRLKGRFSALGRQLPLLLGIVVLASGLASAATAGPFSDVPAGHWAYDALEQLSEAGLVDGYPSGFFSVSRRLTRYEVALSVVRALERLAEQASLAPSSGEKWTCPNCGWATTRPTRIGPCRPAYGMCWATSSASLNRSW